MTAEVGTGARLMPHGQALVAWVASRLDTTDTASEIAKAIGYRLDRCAHLLAEAGHAPLGRTLLERHRWDQPAAWTPPTPVPAPEPDDYTPTTNRPKLTADELLWEIEDAYQHDLGFGDVADMFGVDQATLRRWVRRRGIVAQVEVYYPRRVSGVASAVATKRRCIRGHVMYATPGQRARCRECKRAGEKRRRAA